MHYAALQWPCAKLGDRRQRNERRVRTHHPPDERDERFAARSPLARVTTTERGNTMQMFIPVPDEWDSGEQFAGEVMIPYHVGIPVWRDEKWEREAEEETR